MTFLARLKTAKRLNTRFPACKPLISFRRASDASDAPEGQGPRPNKETFFNLSRRGPAPVIKKFHIDRPMSSIVQQVISENEQDISRHVRADSRPPKKKPFTKEKTVRTVKENKDEFRIGMQEAKKSFNRALFKYASIDLAKDEQPKQSDFDDITDLSYKSDIDFDKKSKPFVVNLETIRSVRDSNKFRLEPRDYIKMRRDKKQQQNEQTEQEMHTPLTPGNQQQQQQQQTSKRVYPSDPGAYFANGHHLVRNLTNFEFDQVLHDYRENHADKFFMFYRYNAFGRNHLLVQTKNRDAYNSLRDFQAAHRLNVLTLPRHIGECIATDFFVRPPLNLPRLFPDVRFAYSYDSRDGFHNRTKLASSGDLRKLWDLLKFKFEYYDNSFTRELDLYYIDKMTQGFYFNPCFLKIKLKRESTLRQLMPRGMMQKLNIFSVTKNGQTSLVVQPRNLSMFKALINMHNPEKLPNRVFTLYSERVPEHLGYSTSVYFFERSDENSAEDKVVSEIDGKALQNLIVQDDIEEVMFGGEDAKNDRKVRFLFKEKNEMFKENTFARSRQYINVESDKVNFNFLNDSLFNSEYNINPFLLFNAENIFSNKVELDVEGVFEAAFVEKKLDEFFKRDDILDLLNEPPTFVIDQNKIKRVRLYFKSRESMSRFFVKYPNFFDALSVNELSKFCVVHSKDKYFSKISYAIDYRWADKSALIIRQKDNDKIFDDQFVMEQLEKVKLYPNDYKFIIITPENDPNNKICLVKFADNETAERVLFSDSSKSLIRFEPYDYRFDNSEDRIRLHNEFIISNLPKSVEASDVKSWLASVPLHDVIKVENNNEKNEKNSDFRVFLQDDAGVEALVSNFNLTHFDNRLVFVRQAQQPWPFNSRWPSVSFVEVRGSETMMPLYNELRKYNCKKFYRPEGREMLEHIKERLGETEVGLAEKVVEEAPFHVGVGDGFIKQVLMLNGKRLFNGDNIFVRRLPNNYNCDKNDNLVEYDAATGQEYIVFGKGAESAVAQEDEALGDFY